jgi:hypothetical protein
MAGVREDTDRRTKEGITKNSKTGNHYQDRKHGTAK